MKIYIGIDNGCTGAISCIQDGIVVHAPMPVKKEQSYTKKQQQITRIDVPKLIDILSLLKSSMGVFALMERAMVNPLRWKASMSAIRALEATLIALEMSNVPYAYIDSKLWQKEFLPNDIVSNKELKNAQKSKLLKQASIDIAKRLFPQIKTKDADSLLIMEYARRKNL